jgi:PAS domain S-box-containing protein
MWSPSLRIAFDICRSSRFPIILFWGRDLVQLYNDAYVPVLGARHPTAFGQRARECWPEVWDAIGPMLHGVLDTGKATWSENLLLPLERNGVPEECYFTFSYSPVADGENVGGVFCAVTETTASVLRERNARERVEALAQLDRLKSDFFNNVSHEFRTPLTLMLGPLDALAKTADDEQRPLIDVARRNALRLLKLVNTLLAFSRLESGRPQARFVETDLASLTTDIVAGFRSAIEGAGLALGVRIDLAQTVFVDRTMWEKIVLNLLSNALKFTLEGAISVELTAHDGTAQLAVSDTGVGMPADELPHIFERFRQIRGAPSRSHEGSGIGLALTKELVQVHGGTITVDSELSRGTKFRVTIPFGRAHLDPALIAPDTDAARSTTIEQYLADAQATIGRAVNGRASDRPADFGAKRARILFADDNHDLRDYVSHVLTPVHDVVTVKNGREALAAARSAPFDLIVSDVMMPEMDGFALLEAVRGDEGLAAIPFIFLSARAGEESAIEGLRRGATDYLIKPFTAEELVARVNAHVDGAWRREAFVEKRTLRRWFDHQGDSTTNEVAFRAFADQLPLPIWQQDIFGSVSYTNRAWHDMLRLPHDPSSHTAQAWKKVIHPDDFPRMAEITTAAIDSRDAFEVTYRLKPSDGDERSYRWYVARAVPQYDASRDFKGWIGSIIDVHAAQLREDAEHQSRLEANRALAEFQALADNIPHVVYTRARDGSIEWANRRWYEITQLPPDIALTPDGWQQVVPAEDLARITAIRENAFAAGVPYEAEIRLKALHQPDSASRWHLIRVVPVRDADGAIVRWAGTGTDVHDRLMAEAERGRDLRALSEALPTIVWTATPDGAGEYFNGRLTEYSGLSPSQAAGDGWLSLVHPDDVERAADTWRAALGAGSRYEVNYRLRRSDGIYRWFSVSGLPLYDATGAIVRWIGTCSDIDDAQRSYDRERRASEAFQQAALPMSLPAVPGLAFSAIYKAGSAEALVGGDWYDAFRLTDGRVVLSVGDVMGSGLSAAVTMSSVRQAIRGAAQIFPDPCAVLDAADRALRSERPEAIVTAFLAIFDPITGTLGYASAGHPAPFLRDAAGAIRELGGSGLPLGLRPEHRSESARHVAIPDGATLVLYTDGLTEATRDVVEGEESLRQALTSAAVLDSPEPARAIADAVLHELHDDVAILVVRFRDVRLRLTATDHDTVCEAHWTFDVGDVRAARVVRDELVAALQCRLVPRGDIALAELLFSELVGNVVRHTGGTAEVVLDLSGTAPVLHVLDRGPGFTFAARLPANPLSESGRGLFIAAMLARDLSIAPRPDGGSHARVVLPFNLKLPQAVKSAASR